MSLLQTDASKMTLGQALPFETLTQIFKVVFEDLVKEYKSDCQNWFYLDLPLILGSVCRYWRDVARQTPQLWTFIQINLSHYHMEEEDNDGGELLRRWIERSQGLPLQLCIEDFDIMKDYDGTVYPLSLFDLDRVWYLSIDNRDLSTEKVKFSSQILGFVYIPDRLRSCWNTLRIPHLRALRLLVPHLLGFAIAHRGIQSLEVEWKDLGVTKDEWTSWRRDIPLAQLSLVSKNWRYRGTGLDNMRYRELVLDNIHPDIWTVLRTTKNSTPIRSLCLRRFEDIPILEFGALFRHKEAIFGKYITKLELTDLPWNGTSWYFTLVYLPALTELYIEHSGYDKMDGTVSRGASPKSVVDELPRLHQTLVSLSRITLLSTNLVKTSGLTEFARLSGRKMEIVLSSRCLPMAERDALLEMPLVAVFLAPDRRTKGIDRRERLHIQQFSR